MKKFVLLSLLISAPAFAAPTQTLKTCSTTVTSPEGDRSIPTVIDIVETDGALKSVTTQGTGDMKVSREDVAEISEHTIRTGLTAQTDPDIGLNRAEMLIVHAMVMTTMPELKGSQNAGIDLTLARSAKVYLIGKPTHMGLSAIVEAKDQDGKVLGSFLGGFLVSPCQ